MTAGDDSDKTMVIKPSTAGKRQPPPKAHLVCVDRAVLKGGAGAEIHLDSTEVTIGRGSTNAVILKADGISRAHARIFPGDGVWGIADLGSTNGVRVNNSKIEQAWLAPGDTVAIGRVGYKYALVEERAKSAAPAQLDLGEGEKTMIMRPGVRPADLTPEATPGADAPAAGAPQPATPKPATPKPAAPKPTASKQHSAAGSTAGTGKSGGMMVWVLLAVAIVAVAAYFLT